MAEKLTPQGLIVGLIPDEEEQKTKNEAEPVKEEAEKAPPRRGGRKAASQK